MSSYWLQARDDTGRYMNPKQVANEINPNSDKWKIASKMASRRLWAKMEKMLGTQAANDVWEAFWAPVAEDATAKDITEMLEREELKWK